MKSVNCGDRVGQELPKDYRKIVEAQVSNLQWRYDAGSSRKGHAQLYPTDRSQSPITIPLSPSSSRSLKNFIAHVRRAGGQWPMNT